MRHRFTVGTADYDRTVKLWDFERQGLEPILLSSPRILQGPAAPVSAIAYSPNGSILASAGEDRAVRLWDPVTGQKRGTLTGHIAAVVDLAFSPDGEMLASAGVDSTVRLWRAPQDVEGVE